ncbi:hypothetical protein L873DRAFT_1838467 [Choiromyces venosus 120613-1]|uniref:Uncharacterized protein n=1 Tax=Choiromyces venosus 120613-1 TaxID=1336337 RepID=A0A3N4J705_9PEZI|nr:hypothetical protein L873DRAFT_1838467 [Choiromyces venosus 120613-1]
MANKQKENTKDPNEEEGRGEHESNIGEGMDDEEFSMPPPPPSNVQPPGEMSYAKVAAADSYPDQFERDEKGENDNGDKTESGKEGEKSSGDGATEPPDTKEILNATSELQPGDISVNIGGTGSPPSPETKELKPVKLRPDEIGDVGMEHKDSTIRGMSAEGDEIMEALKVSDRKGGKDEAVKEESSPGEPTRTEPVPKRNGEVKKAPKVDEEEDIKPSVQDLSEEQLGSGDSGPSPRQPLEIKESSPGAMAGEHNTVDREPGDIGSNVGTIKGHDEAVNGKKPDKPSVKRVSFAPEPSESNLQDKSTISPETKELEKIADVAGEFGYNIGEIKGHDRAIDEKQHSQPTETKSDPRQESGISPETEELGKIADIPGEFGYNVGTIKGHDRAIDEKRQGKPIQTELHLTQQQSPNPETEELKKIADVIGEFGYNVGTIKGHDRAIDNKHHDKPTSNEAQAPASATSMSRFTDVGAERTPESRELGNMTLGSGEFGYNVGDLPSSHPGRHKTHGADNGRQGTIPVPGSGVNAGIKEGQKTNDINTTAPAMQSQNEKPAGTAESQELGNITIERGEFGYNVGGLQSSHPDRPKTHRQHPSRQFQGEGGTAPESEELGRITIESGEFGYNVGGLPSSHPDRHRRHSHGRLQDKAGQETPETRELSQIQLGKGEFGYNIGNLEHHRRGEEKENPIASEIRHRNEQPTNGSPGHISHMRDSGYYGPSDEEDSHFTQNKESQKQPPFTHRTPSGAATNDTLQSYLHSFISQSSSRPISPPPSADVYPHAEEGGSRGKGTRRMMAWGVIGVGVITALGLAALWGSNHPAMGLGFREGVDWSDKFAEWLFKEGKKGSP